MKIFRNISIFGSYSGYNKGDLAILTSIIQNFPKKNRFNFYISSKKPAELKKFIKNKNVIFYKTITSYLGINTVKYLSNSDLIIFGGGGLFFDKNLFNPFYNHLINIFLITILNELFFRKPIYVFGVGASHLNSFLALQMTKYILSKSDYISVRDNNSKELFQKLSDKEINLYYDPVFLLSARKTQNVSRFFKSLKSKKKICIIINEKLVSNNNIEQELIRLINTLQIDYFVTIFENVNNQKHANKLFQKCKNNNLTLFPENLSPKEIIYFLSHFEFVISAPMHGSIFAYQGKSNIVTIDYNDKVRELNKIIGNANHVEIGSLNEIPNIIQNYKKIEFRKNKNIENKASQNFVNLNLLLNKYND